ncbi:MAG: hypothetical protein ACREOG_09355, partial [Gemmatimonadaceae bacterium]
MTSACAVRLGLTCTIVLSVTSCSPTPRYVINAPANSASITCSDPASVSCDVAVDVQWDGVSVRPHPEATLDGAPLATAFTTSGKSSVATITTSLGSHTLVVSGDLAAKGTVATYSATSVFSVT